LRRLGGQPGVFFAITWKQNTLKPTIIQELYKPMACKKYDGSVARPNGATFCPHISPRSCGASTKFGVRTGPSFLGTGGLRRAHGRARRLLLLFTY